MSALRDAMCAAFLDVRMEKYAYQGAKDTEALKRMMKTGPPEEILRRWRWSLTEDGFAGCNDIADLARKWNHYSGMEPGYEESKPKRRFDPNQGILTNPR